MAAVIETKVGASYKPVPVVGSVVGAGLDLIYTPSRVQTLLINNKSEDAASIKITATPAGGEYIPGGIGAAVDLSAGYTIPAPVGLTALSLKEISRYLSGAILLTLVAPNAEVEVSVIS